MEVKRKGITSTNWRREVSCPACKAILAISAEDVILRHETRLNHILLTKRIIPIFSVKCKECGSTIRLRKRELPSIVIDHLYTTRNRRDFIWDILNFYFS